MNIAPFLRAFQWLVSHWKLWGIPTLIAGAAKYIQMWFSLRKAHQELKNSQLEGQRLQAEIDKLQREKAAVERELQIEKMAADIENSVTALPPNHIGEIVCGLDDDPDIFQEAIRRWKKGRENMTNRKPRFAGRF